jgi:hypothetical protein
MLARSALLQQWPRLVVLGFHCHANGDPESTRLRKWYQQTFEDLDSCGLPRPIRPEQAEALAGLEPKVQSTHRLHFAVVSLAQIAALDGGSHARILA